MTVLQRLGLSLSSAVRRARRRVADAGWSIVQTPVAAALAWYIAHTLLGHPQPFFAPVAAAPCRYPRAHCSAASAPCN